MLRFALIAAALFAPLAPASAMPPDFLKISAITPDVVQDIRYARDDNFLGEAAPGYDYPACWLRLKAALALSRVAGAAAEAGYRLAVFDCYRPQSANAAFMRWLSAPPDAASKQTYYPRMTKAQVFARGYIVRKSAHSTGFAVALGLLTKGGRPLDFAGDYDLFDPRSATASFEVGVEARTNRAVLAGLMSQKGFVNDPKRWWEFEMPQTNAPAYDDAIER